MSDTGHEQGTGDEFDVLVQVASLDGNRQISSGAALPEALASRLDDIRAAMRVGGQSVLAGADALPPDEKWRLSELSATFGITLTAEAGVIVSKATAGCTFEVTLTFQRAEPAADGS
ncbi:CU044_2847 family protein [Streptomyces microflavus]|jgi:hypothetical protein|uniref:Trypsin-co-occurring domain-containing protein n=1 Tax=Streptomyces microflavus TaxID=1919 RepID=A0A7J0CQ05_STRMI|nr:MULTISPECIES: CU044_2847 family protein [Streptomyces]MCX4652926.1 CU044_2847 family protein [Streptomyces microflavus]MDX2406247.1 hypothetical protein [Streptomyces microflavus]MDX2981530.1 CU044_2847 family protein [Streptomyces sp. NRRL_B-2249]OXY87865.1 hypothetical protein BEH93_11790 [Streptomyces sp. 2R]QQZ54623.1 hypothetical protein IFE09_14095 [Streptomyces microflavus]